MNQQNCILVVDDEELNRELLDAQLACLGHCAEFAENGVEALAKLTSDIDLVLLDAMMPEMDGFTVAGHIRQDPQYYDLPIIMVTALSGKADRLRAVEAGANDFITKPVDRIELQVRTASLLKMKAAQDAVKRQRAELAETVRQQTAELRQAVHDLAEAQRRTHEAHLDTIHRLALAAEYRDNDTSAHIHRVGAYCALIARALGLPEDEVEIIRHASPMHDVGKLGIPDAILLKPGRLSPEERAVIEQHALNGARILGGSEAKLLQVGEIIALSHHEKWDGSGYPYKLAGEEIPLYGRICAVVDVFDALTSNRPYKEAFSNEKACDILRAGRGTHFDPRLLDLFFAHFSEVLAIQQQYRDE